jgi:UDP-N-acetylmuramoylalanine--D-glutamate ligase
MIPATHFANRTVAVFGLGRSGLAAALALIDGGATVSGWDDADEARDAARAAGVPVADLSGLDFAGLDALVLSPGIPFTHPAPHGFVVRARSAGCEVIGDIEVFLREGLPAARVGISGTNGKSTTTALLAHLLRHCGRQVAAGGNLGAPVLGLPALGADGVYVLELSSYQIDLTPSLVCDVAVLLNISPDHLDRHGGMEGYVAVKKRLFANAPATAIVGVDDSFCADIYAGLKARGATPVIPIAVGAPAGGGVWVEDGVLHDDRDATAIDLADAAALRGRHNWQNAAAAYAAARALGGQAADIAAALLTFPGLAHRMESVGSVDGVLFVNDSKATNVTATARALASFDAIYWIAGGRAKEASLDAVAPFFPRLRHAYLIGEAAAAFAAALSGKVAHTVSGDLASAVAAAHAQAVADGEDSAVVLLSPACASFDQWRDFEARGDAFRDLAVCLSGHRGEAP